MRSSAVAVLLGLLALVPALALTPPEGTGFQPDNLVLGLLTAGTAVRAARLTRGMTGRPAVAWRLLAGAGALFSLASLVTGSGLAGAFGVAGIGDLLLVPVLAVPPAVCVLLAAQVRTAGWSTLVVDGASVVLASFVVVDVLALSSPDRTGPPAPLTVVYVGYAVLAVGLAGALCTTTTRELRRSATAMVVANLLIALAVAMLAVGIDRPVLLWQALGDLACLLCLEVGVVAIACSPRHPAGPDDAVARSPRVNAAGLLITVVALGGVPVALVVAVARGQVPTGWSLACVAAVVALLLVRSSLRVRTSARLVAEVVRNEEDLRSLVEGSTDGVVIVDDDLRVQFASPAARALLDLPDDAGPPPHLPDLVVADDRPRVEAQLRAGTTRSLHLRVAGPEPTTELEVTPHHRADGGRRVLHLRDATDRRSRERELERMAYTDHLTQLPNRAELFRQLGTPADARCLLVVDLDGFKAVNDVAGHETGDQLLVEVARRLRTVVREQDVVCRLGGDEFALVVDGELPDAVEAAQRVVDVLALPYRTGDHTFAVGGSVGAAPLTSGGGPLAFRRADAALRVAKRAGKGCVRVWEGGADGAVDGAATGSVTAALAAGQVEVRYSIAGRADGPQRALHGQPFWRLPSGDLLPSADLWSAAGHQGCDAELQTWVLAEATRQAAATPGTSLLALDLPAGHVHAEQLVDDVRQALAASGLPAERLSLAVTEAAVVTSTVDLVPTLRELRALGVRLCLDDFGLGQTLYSHLARVPFTSVRIDVSALPGQDDEQQLLRVVRAIVRSAGEFGLVTIAHGVSPGPLLDAVLACGVHMVRTREDLRHVSLERVHREFGAAPEGARILSR